MTRLPVRNLLARVADLAGFTWFPADVEDVAIMAGRGRMLGGSMHGTAAQLGVTPTPHDPGTPLTLTSWNLQFAGGRRHFFYDGGRDVHVPTHEVEATLRAIVDTAFADETPTLLLLQELDRGSDRTGRLDELVPFLERMAACASTPYHRARFVPVPAKQPLGRVELHLATLGSVAFARARRIALPLLNEPAWRRAFNLKRCLLEVDVPLADGRVLKVGNTHLSAFSRGDGTLPRQVDVLARWMAEQRAAGHPFVLAGDLNLLPPGDEPSRLPDPHNYADDGELVRKLLIHARSAVPGEAWLAPEWRTYQPYGSAPDRVLDYLFVSPDIDVEDVRVVATEASDHLPLTARLRINAA